MVTSAFGHLLKIRGESLYYKHLNKDEQSWPYLVRLIKRTQKIIRVKCGEVDPKFWEKPEIIDELREFLQRDGAVEFVFSKFNEDGSPVTSLERAKQLLEGENKNLVALAKQFPKRVRLYWLKERAKQHYQIGDNQDLIMEEFNHAVNGKRSADILFNYNSYSETWIKRFDDAIKADGVKVISYA